MLGETLEIERIRQRLHEFELELEASAVCLADRILEQFCDIGRGSDHIGAMISLSQALLEVLMTGVPRLGAWPRGVEVKRKPSPSATTTTTTTTISEF